ncbi:hypothetical protein FOL47_005774 [Perkinsus chesapeaki]|uniref:RRM domain-containing protein n=1 Tax=Perkinsus chesapeaki TaxID=330153 RepID=A0A7J6LVU5_PERCH|nr:hypothetical protein FOL47_005774 [Perkinsus chesapeaki]
MTSRGRVRLPPEVNRIIYVRNLPYKIKPDELYDVFGKFGSIRQIRKGNAPGTKGTAFVIYDDIYDAKNAVDHLSGFNVAGRYLVCLYYSQKRLQQKLDAEGQKAEIERLKREHNLFSFSSSIVFEQHLSSKLMAIIASTSSPVVVKDDDDIASSTLSTCDDERVSVAQHRLEALSNEYASIVGMCHPLLDLVATIDDFNTYGLEPATQRLTTGGILERLSCQLGESVFVITNAQGTWRASRADTWSIPMILGELFENLSVVASFI